MKRQTTRHGRRWSSRIATSFLGLSLLLAGGLAAPAQEAGSPPRPTTRTLFFGRAPLIRTAEPDPRVPVATTGPRASAPGEIQPTALQLPGGPDSPGRSQAYESIEFEPPGPERLFRLESDAAVRERWRQEVRSKTPQAGIEFPVEPVVSTTKTPYSRHWVWGAFPDGRPLPNSIEPSYVCYQRTLFEQKNFDRYGWDIGALTPFICASKFYWDVFWLPYHLGEEPCRHFECNAGYCLPGDPTPLYLYPPHLSVTGLAAEAGAITAGVLIFP